MLVPKNQLLGRWCPYGLIVNLGDRFIKAKLFVSEYLYAITMFDVPYCLIIFEINIV